MKLPILSSLVAIFSMACSALAGPEAGLYTGTVVVSRFLGEEGLMSKYSLRVQARIKEDGSITILSSAPELPRTTTVEDAVTRAVPIPSGMVMLHNLPAQPQVTPMPSPSPLIFPLPSFGNYLVDGKFPANVSVKGKIVTLHYQNPAQPEVIIQEREFEIGKPINLQFAPPAVSFLFTLKKSAK